MCSLSRSNIILDFQAGFSFLTFIWVHLLQIGTITLYKADIVPTCISLNKE
jgi:hypothetical protein